MLTWSVWPDLVKVVRMQSSRWSSVSSLERWVCRKAFVLVDQSSVWEYMMKVSSYPWNIESMQGIWDQIGMFNNAKLHQ